jgi:glutamate-1-semialdehyde aminotransferase
MAGNLQQPDDDPRPRAADLALRDRASAVIPGGMYGHQSVRLLPPEYPQFMRGGRGARIWDVDGNEYVDLVCSYGPVVLGHRHIHPRHNWFVSAAMTDDDVTRVLDATDQAFAAVRKRMQ